MNEQKMSPEQIRQLAAMVQNAEDVKCVCGSIVFIQGNKLKRISRLVTGEQYDKFVPLPGLICGKCGEEMVLDDMGPEPDNIIKL